MFPLPAASDHASLLRDFSWEIPARFNIAAAVCQRWASSEPERLALVVEDEAGTVQRWTFGALHAAVCQLSNVLAALGVMRGDRVAVILPQRAETAIAHLACYQMGAIVVPLSHLFGPEALATRLNDCAARLAIVDAQSSSKLQGHAAALASLRQLISVDPPQSGLPDMSHEKAHALPTSQPKAAAAPAWRMHEWQRVLPLAASTYPACDTAADDPALLLYTSGTTGNPKGALLPHRALLGNLPGFVCSHDFFPQPGDFFWSPADWAWTGGIFDALLPTWYFGQPQLAYQGRFTPEKAYALLEAYGVRNAFLFPTALKRMMQAEPEPRQRYRLQLRSVMSGGESLGSEVLAWAQAQLGVTINEIYGQTEMNYLVGGCAALWPARPGAIGKPYPGHRVAVIDAAGQPCAPGELGEIALAAGRQAPDPVLFLGYWNNPLATEAKYSGAWVRSGDLARVDADGYFWFHGRSDDVINSSGYRIGPTEIEHCLRRHPAVAQAAVVGVADATRGEVIKAVIVLQAGYTGDEALADALRAQVRMALAPYEVPRLIEFVDELPLTTSGKIIRRLLR